MRPIAHGSQDRRQLPRACCGTVRRKTSEFIGDGDYPLVPSSNDGSEQGAVDDQRLHEPAPRLIGIAGFAGAESPSRFRGAGLPGSVTGAGNLVLTPDGFHQEMADRQRYGMPKEADAFDDR